MSTLVSICIGAYNRKSYIRECVDSALAQTWPHKEVVVVDDASTDGTREILQSYGASIRLILRDSNSGICPITRNQAVAAATGEYVAFLDSDDVWHLEKLAKQVAFMERHPDVPLCHTLCNVIDGQSRVVGIRHGAGVVPETGMIFERLLEHCWVTISTVMVRKSLFAEVGWFNPEAPYGYLGEDHEFFLRVARRHPIGLVPEVLAGFRKAGQGITSKNWRANPEPVPLFQALLERRDIWGDVVPWCRMVRALTDKCSENAYFYRNRCEWSRVAWFARQALKADLSDLRAWRHWAAALVQRT
ncbi:MAG: glycosyltransferase family 2 protein [Deltaproteobacteria bacterium]|nr:glycosyltransferase family 2 protein [Deltaproteobacteria bacterium]